MNQDEKITKEIVKLKDEIGKCLTAQDFSEFKDEVLTGQDEMIAILRRLDDERVFTLDRVKQLEADVKQIKLKLAIA